MTDNSVTKSAEALNKLNLETLENSQINKGVLNECDATEEAATSGSEEYLSEPLRYRNFSYSTSSENSNITLVAQNMSLPEVNGNFFTNDDINMNNIQIPIVGYEIMEERARFTVYKLRIENKASGDYWYVFRRYTDFVRLCNRLRSSYPHVVQHLPRKRWLKNNFDPIFLDERVSGLQTLVNAILREHALLMSQEIQDFFCLNEPPMYSETNEESRAMFEALEESINDLKQQLREKDIMIDGLQDTLHSTTTENESLKKIIRSSTMNCQKCQKDCENLTKEIIDGTGKKYYSYMELEIDSQIQENYISCS